MENFNKRRPTNYSTTGPGVIGKGSMYAAIPLNGQQPRVPLAPVYNTNGNNTMPQSQAEDLSAIAEGFGRIKIASPGYNTLPKANGQMSAQASEYGGVALGHNMPTQVSDMNGVPLASSMRPAFMYNGLMFAPSVTHSAAPTHNALPGSPGMFAPVGPHHFLAQPSFAGYPGQLMNGRSPLAPGWQSSRVSSAEVPSLVTNRRSSNSSNELEGPGTPFTNGTPLTNFTGYGGEYHPGVAVMDRSPHSIYTWGTPSPASTGYAMGKVQPQAQNTITPRLQLLVQQQPPIPRAVPAPYSPMKPLDRSLENPNGVTNVYIRGLLPHTTDETLYALASRFGEIASSKSIIDHVTGQCKGYGFVKFHNFSDAEDCIRGFHYMGYETSFARESFYSQLKKLSDETNTNLYVSNLPKDMNEHELGAIFGPHKVCSSRILRDASGNGRGVGFARFESRDVCEEVIKHYNNTPVAKKAGEEHLIQIRYADTQDQKSLKQQTTAARQYRSAEYESQTSGHGSPAGSVRTTLVSLPPHITENDFETYLSRTTLPYAQSVYGHVAVTTPDARLESIDEKDQAETAATSDFEAPLTVTASA